MGSPLENGYGESVNGELRGEPLNGEFCYSLRDVEVPIDRRRVFYHTKYAHSLVGYRQPAPETEIPDQEILCRKMLRELAVVLDQITSACHPRSDGRSN